MPDDLYDRDFFGWSAEQAALLERLAAGERVNAAVDWPHIVDEVRDLGKSELHQVRSLLRQAMFHLIKLRAGADRPRSHWRGEVAVFLADAASRFSPSMRQHLDIDDLYGRAAQAARESGASAPDACPYTLDELLAEQVSVDTLLGKLA